MPISHEKLSEEIKKKLRSNNLLKMTEKIKNINKITCGDHVFPLPRQKTTTNNSFAKKKPLLPNNFKRKIKFNEKLTEEINKAF